MRYLTVFNTCGISGTENSDHYISALQSIIDQDHEDNEILVSSCLNSREVRDRLVNHFKDKLHYHFIDKKLTVNMSFNLSVINAVKILGDFDGYIYVDSGVTFDNSKSIISEIEKRHETQKYSMVSIQTDTDTGYKNWFGRGEHDYFEEDFTVPLGKCCNLHVQLFTKELFEAFSAVIPDIFAAWATESTFSFLNAAIKKQWTIVGGNIVKHLISMDGASSGFPSHSHGDTWDNLLCDRRMSEIINKPEAKSSGFGFEEWRGILNHDPSRFDENMHSKDEELKKFIKENLFLNKSEFDYNQIGTQFLTKGAK